MHIAQRQQPQGQRGGQHVQGRADAGAGSARWEPEGSATLGGRCGPGLPPGTGAGARGGGIIPGGGLAEAFGTPIAHGRLRPGVSVGNSGARPDGLMKAHARMTSPPRRNGAAGGGSNLRPQS
ncbi:hypothetical protein Stsp02_57240 [Streptomyces sp. NBRC 14336]|nr:hypothetical protein Stsp02_57240 [Streptomyces sp. NBRC 14336]